MKIRKVLVLILLVLTLSLTTTIAVTPKNNLIAVGTLIQTATLQQPTQKAMTIIWGTETRANTNTTDLQQMPCVCCLPDGSGLVVVWVSAQTGDYDIYFKLFDAIGHNNTDDIRVNDNITGMQSLPSVSCFPDGSGLVVVWVSDQTGDDDIYAKVFNSTGHNQTEDILVNTNTLYGQLWPSVSCFPEGFVVVWESEESSGYYRDVYAQIFNKTGYKQTANDIQVNTITWNHQWEPSVSCFPDGSGFAVAWCGYSGPDDGGIYAKIFDSTGNNQTDDVLVNNYTIGIQSEPSVSCFPNSSNFVVAWQGNGEGNLDCIYAQILNKTGYAQTANDIRVNTYINSQDSPSVWCFPDGSGFVISWESYLQDGDGIGVYVGVFDSLGNRQTGETQVNTYVMDDQWFPSVCCLSNESFVVAWQSMGQDGDNLGVYFRIGNLTPSVLPLPLLFMVFLLMQSVSGVSAPLLVGGVLVVAGVAVAGVLVSWWFRRRT